MDSQVVQELLPGTGSLGSVPMQHNYKRTVLRSPPKHFSVELLPCRKFGNGYCYGMRIHPLGQGAVHCDTTSTKSGSTSSSSGASASTTYAPYEIWRRWEDCLWFQDLLETEYKLMARTKRTRLQQGKGVKKDGVYIHSDQAASFESLPPGPDANTIAKDVHEILPKLTKRGTIFKAGRDTIEQRDREFHALIERLWDDDMPVLMCELRENRIIRDFFGYWRRDKDHDRKLEELQAADKGKNRASRISITSSAFSMYFSSSNISLQLPNAYSDYPPSPSAPSASGSSSLGGKPKGKARSASFSSVRSSKAASSSRAVPRSAPATNGAISFTVSENGALVPTSPTAENEDPLDNVIIVPPTTEVRHPLLSKAVGSLPVLSEEQEQEDIIETPPSSSGCSFPPTTHTTQPLRFTPPAAATPIPQLAAPTPLNIIRRPRNLSCPDPGHRNGLVLATTPPTHRPQSIVSAISATTPARPPSLSMPASNSEQYDDAQEKSPIDHSDDDGPFSRRTSWRTSTSSTTSGSGSGGSLSPQSPVPRPYSMFSTLTSGTNGYFDGIDIERYIDETGLDLDLGVSFDDMMMLGEERKGNDGKGFHLRESVATMNSIVTNSSVDAVLPHSRIPRLRSRSGSAERNPSRDVETPIPGPAPVDPDDNAQTLEIPDEEFIDSYFYDPAFRAEDSHDEDAPRHSPPASGYSTPRRERISHFVTQQISTPEHFPKPFQHRPPGQFHLPWTPTEPTPPTPPFPSTPAFATSFTSSTSSSSRISTISTISTITTSTSLAGEHFTVKAIRQDSIVLLRVARTMSLALVRERLRDKFASQEHVSLTAAFTIGFNPAAIAGDRQSSVVHHPGSGRPRAQSASAGQQPQPRLRFITNDAQWEEALVGSGGKLTVHIFDRF